MPGQKEKNANPEVEEVVEEQATDVVENESPAETADENKFKELEEKLAEWEDKYKRLYAEFDNYQKRTTKEKDLRYSDAVIDIVLAFLPVADNLDRAIAT